MRKLYPFGWIDRDLKNPGFLRDMSASAAKIYILYVLSGGTDGRGCYSTKILKQVTGLSTATICRAKQELKDMDLITIQKEMVCGHKNKKPKIWVELQDLPVDRLEVKHRRPLIIAKRYRVPPEQSQPRTELPDWIKQAAEKLRRRREGYV